MTVSAGEELAAAAWRRAAISDLEARFPGAVVWLGRQTGSWWALVGRGAGPVMTGSVDVDSVKGSSLFCSRSDLVML